MEVLQEMGQNSVLEYREDDRVGAPRMERSFLAEVCVWKRQADLLLLLEKTIPNALTLI